MYIIAIHYRSKLDERAGHHHPYPCPYLLMKSYKGCTQPAPSGKGGKIFIKGDLSSRVDYVIRPIQRVGAGPGCCPALAIQRARGEGGGGGCCPSCKKEKRILDKKEGGGGGGGGEGGGGCTPCPPVSAPDMRPFLHTCICYA